MAEEKKDLLGPTGERVRRNVERLRTTRGMTKKDVSDRARELGNPIPPLGVSRIEAGTRRVDADDLVTLALVFNVSPLTLLLPLGSNQELIALTRNQQVTSRTAWQWAEGERTAMEWTPGEGVNFAEPGADPAISVENYEQGQEFARRQAAYRALAQPEERRRAQDHKTIRLARELTHVIQDLVIPQPSTDARSLAALARMASRRHQQLGIELDEIRENLPVAHPGFAPAAMSASEAQDTVEHFGEVQAEARQKSKEHAADADDADG